jgi:dihydrofolate reductase
MTRLAIVVAVARNGVIGRGGTLPWHLPDDLRQFRALTIGKPILMGRRTFESIGRPLPGRQNLVLSHDAAFAAEGVERVTTLDAAIAAAGGAPEIAVIGGAAVYALVLPRALRLHVTEVAADVDGDTFFPAYDRSKWREIDRTPHAADARHAWAMDFVTYERWREP